MEPSSVPIVTIVCHCYWLTSAGPARCRRRTRCASRSCANPFFEETQGVPDHFARGMVETALDLGVDQVFQLAGERDIHGSITRAYQKLSNLVMGVRAGVFPCPCVGKSERADSFVAILRPLLENTRVFFNVPFQPLAETWGQGEKDAFGESAANLIVRLADPTASRQGKDFDDEKAPFLVRSDHAPALS